jgi:hypothetical protein
MAKHVAFQKAHGARCAKFRAVRVVELTGGDAQEPMGCAESQ